MTDQDVRRIAGKIYYYAGGAGVQAGRFLMTNDLIYRKDDGDGEICCFSSRGASFCYDRKGDEAVRQAGIMRPLFPEAPSQKDISDVLEVMRRQSLFMDAPRYVFTKHGTGALYDIGEGVCVILEHIAPAYILYGGPVDSFAGMQDCRYDDFNPDGSAIDFTGVWELPGDDKSIRELDSGVGRARSIIAKIMGITGEYGVPGGAPTRRINGFDLLSEELEKSRGLFYSPTT